MLAHIFSRRFQKASRPRRTHHLRTLRHPESLEGRALLATLAGNGSEWVGSPLTTPSSDPIIALSNFSVASPQGAGVDYSGQSLLNKDFAYRDFSGANFANANLAGTTFRGAVLRGADLTYANLANVDFSGTDLSNATLSGGSFTNARFSINTIWPADFNPLDKGMWGPGVDYSGQDLSNKDLAYRDFTGAKFAGANLTNANFRGTVLKNANFTDATLTEVEFSGSDLTDATLTGASFTNARFSVATIWPAGFNPLDKGMWGPGADYSGQDLSNKDLAYRDFTGANFAGANLANTNFRDAVLKNANFTDATLTGVEFSGSDLTDATLTNAAIAGAWFSVNTIWPTGFNPLDKGMWGPGVDYSGQDLSNKDLAYRDFTGANFAGANLTATTFRGTTLKNAFLINANLADADLTNAELTGARYTLATVWPAGFDPVAAGALLVGASPPTQIILSSTSIAENQAAGAIVGLFSTTDPDVGDAFTYALVNGDGDGDNASFTIAGGTLKASENFDYETKTSYSIRVRSTDLGGFSVETVFVIKVINLGETATDLQQGLIARYELDGNASDGSGNGRNGVTNNATPATDRFGRGNAALSFNGIDSVVVVPHDSSLNALPLSVSMWFQTTASSGGLIGKYQSAGWNGYQIGMGSGGTFWPWYVVSRGQDVIGNYDVASDNNPAFRSTPLNDGNWHNLVFTVDASGGALFVDGLLQATKEWRGAPTPVTTNLPLFIGQYFGEQNGFFKGLIDDVRIYDRVLSPAEVSLLNTSAPTDIALSPSSIAENQPIGTVVGTLSTTDSDADDSFLYTLVNGDGDTDNASFKIVGDTLETAASFDYEANSSYSIRVRSTDRAGLFTEKVLAISVTDIAEPPTVTSVSIAGGDGRFSHGIVMVSVVFSSPVFVDDAGGTPTLTLETGAVDRLIPYSRGSGSTTLEFSYTIQSGDTTEDLDYVSSSALALNGGTIRDGFGVDADLTLPSPGEPGSIGDNNEIAIDTTLPTITLSNLLSDPVNGTVGIVAIDLSEPLFGFDYFDDVEFTRNGELLTLDDVSWTGSGLNYSFDLFGGYNALPGIYELRIKAATAGITDVAGNALVDDAVLSWVVGVPPTDIDLSPTMVGENLPVGTVVGLLSTADDDIGDSFTYALVAGDGADDNASFTIRDGELLTAKSFTAATQGTYSIRIESTDAAGYTVEKAFTITVVGKPGAPTGVTGTPAHGSVRLSWTAPVSDGGAPITDYVIEYKREGSATWSTFARDPSDATTAHVTGLANYARYVFRVSAVNVAGTGHASTISSIVMPLPLPGMPTGLTAVPGDGRVTLSWSAPPPSAGVPAVIDYVVQFSDNDGATWATFNDGRSAATSATVTRLANGVSYVFRVQAVNSAGTGTASLPSAAVTPRRAPGSPTGVTATPGNTSVTLSWVAPASSGGAVVTDYIVQYSTSGVSWTTFNDAVSATTSATVTGLVNGAAYMFRVSAVNAAGMGKPSLPSARVTPVTIPGTPTSVAATFTNGQVRVSWAAPAASGGTPITDFIVQWSTNSGETWTTLADGRSTVPSTTVTGLPYGSSYAFRVAAVNAVGMGAFSTASAAVRLETVPGAPTGVIATAGNGRATVAWTAPASTGGTPITDYLIQYSRNNGTTWTTFADGMSNATSATVTGLVNGVAYVFRIAAVNAPGKSAFSIKSAAITPVSFTAAGVTLGAVEFGSTQLGYAFRQDSVVRQVTTSGRNVAAGFIGTGWTMRAVWESDTGYQAFWADRSGRHAVWTLDSSGRFVTTKVLTASQLATLETELKFDLNGNGKSG